MTDEERQKTIEFILDSQARAEVRATQADERAVRADGRLDRLERMMQSMAVLYDRERRDLREKLTALTDAQIRAEAEVKDFRASVGQAMTMLENSQDKLAAAMIESQRSHSLLENSHDKIATAIIELQQGQRQLQEGQRAMQKAMAEMAQAVVSAHQRIDGIERNGKQP